jgi:Fur family ferric uptake transcriptional regulator
VTSPAPRQTRQRAAVKGLLDDLDEFRSAQQVHEALRSRGESIGLTTVYRTLQALADAGEVDLRANADGETVYRKCSDHHHHHLVCRQCGATVEIAGPAVERWVDSVADQHGFTSVNHTFEIVGLCSACSA